MPPYMFSEKQPCGTYAAYRRHLYYGEPPCLPCREARAATARNEYHRKTRRQAAATGKSTGWQPGMAADVMALLDYCEAVDGPDWIDWREGHDEDGAA